MATSKFLSLLRQVYSIVPGQTGSLTAKLKGNYECVLKTQHHIQNTSVLFVHETLQKQRVLTASR